MVSEAALGETWESLCKLIKAKSTPLTYWLTHSLDRRQTKFIPFLVRAQQEEIFDYDHRKEGLYPMTVGHFKLKTNVVLRDVEAVDCIVKSVVECSRRYCFK